MFLFRWNSKPQTHDNTLAFSILRRIGSLMLFDIVLSYSHACHDNVHLCLHALRCDVLKFQIATTKNLQYTNVFVLYGIGSGCEKEKLGFLIRDIEILCLVQLRLMLGDARTKTDAKIWNLSVQQQLFTTIRHA